MTADVGGTPTLALPRGRDDDPDLLAALLWQAGAVAVQILPDAVEGTFTTRVDDVLPGGTWRRVPDEDWLALWREGLEVVIAGHVEIVPTWLADTTPRVARHRLVLDPDQAFGSGHHDTTAGCLEAMASLDLTGRSVLDVGTGTGILALAAALAGASPVLAIDIDPSAVVVARRNADAAGLVVDTAVGSVGDASGRWDVVFANLLTPTVLALADALVGATAAAGTLIVSGVGAQRAPRVEAALRDAGAADVRTTIRGEWAILVATH